MAERFVRTLELPVPVAILWAFHERPDAFARLQPPWENAEVIELPRSLEVGAPYLVMDLLRQHVQRGDTVIGLQPREYKLLEYLMHHAGQVVTRAMLLEHVWGYHFDPQTNVIDVHISRLRQKIDKDFDQQLLHTVRGSGYILRDPGAASERPFDRNA